MSQDPKAALPPKPKLKQPLLVKPLLKLKGLRIWLVQNRFWLVQIRTRSEWCTQQIRAKLQNSLCNCWNSVMGNLNNDWDSVAIDWFKVLLSHNTVGLSLVYRIWAFPSTKIWKTACIDTLSKENLITFAKISCLYKVNTYWME